MKTERKEQVGFFYFMMIIGLFLLNFGDTCWTLYYISNNHGTEINPLMDYLVKHSVQWFIFIKTTIMAAACFGLWIRRNVLSARFITYIVFVYYVVLNIYFYVGYLLIKAGY